MNGVTLQRVISNYWGRGNYGALMKLIRNLARVKDEDVERRKRLKQRCWTTCCDLAVHSDLGCFYIRASGSFPRKTGPQSLAHSDQWEHNRAVLENCARVHWKRSLVSSLVALTQARIKWDTKLNRPWNRSRSLFRCDIIRCCDTLVT